MAAEQERKCIEEGCEEPAGTPWTPLWCRQHDEERRERITASIERIRKSFAALHTQASDEGKP